jgi:hypothetical protein
VRLDRNVLAAGSESEAYGRYDLVTVLAHELGHVLGLDHEDSAHYAVMAQDIDPGVRYVLDAQAPVGGAAAAPAAAPVQPEAPAIPAFDFDALLAGRGSNAPIDWHAGSGGDWGLQVSPYAPVKAAQKPASGMAQFATQPVFDSLGKALLGKGK